jgi:hypothetical protein
MALFKEADFPPRNILFSTKKIQGFIGGFHRNPTSCLDDKILPVHMRISLFYFPIHLDIAIASFATVTVGKSKAFGCI